MAIPCYLAMTAAEFAAAQEFPENIAWMACHFSCYGTGLSNLPRNLPAGAMIVVNDRTPIHGHDPGRICEQLGSLIEQFACSAVLLDFQRPDIEETAALCKVLAQRLHCPVGITEFYAGDLDGPVFLSSLPLRRKLAEHLAPWDGREVWLEAALDCEEVTVTKTGSHVSPGTATDLPDPWFPEEQLHCRYHWEVADNAARFTLLRTRTELTTLLCEAKTLGVTRAVGLYQQLGTNITDIE